MAVETMLKRIAKAILKTHGQPNGFYKLIFRQTFYIYIRKKVSHFIGVEDRVLDVGSRIFQFTSDVPCRELWGIDLISESDGELGWTDTFLKWARGRGIKLIIANAEEIPLPSDSMDKVILTEVLEHIERDDNAIGEIQRILKKDGALLVTTPNGNEVPNTNPFHFRHYRPAELKTLLERHFNSVYLEYLFPWSSFYEMQFRYEHKPVLFLFFSHAYNFFYAIFGFFLSGRGYILLAKCRDPKGEKPQFPNCTPIELVCPICKKVLVSSKNGLSCLKCHKDFDSYLGIPVLLTQVPHHQAKHI
jgi:ubiquinone/menaquinone biosynthesis C-methylase UbiE